MLVTGTQIPTEATLPTNHFAITAHDVNNFTNYARSIYFGTGGTAVLVTADGTAVTYNNIPNGAEIVGVFKRVNATGLTAANMVGRW